MTVIEKIWMIFDHLQLFSLLWVMGCLGDLKWPAGFCEGSKRSVLVNLDTRALISRGDLSEADLPIGVKISALGSEGGPVLWFWAPGVLIVIYFLIRGTILLLGRRYSWFRLDRLLLAIGDIGYVPFLLHTFRHLGCNESELSILPQPDVGCNMKNFQTGCKIAKGCTDITITEYLMFFAGLIAAAIYTFGLPLTYYFICKKRAIYRSTTRHEHFLKSLETEFLLKLTDDWHRTHMSVFSSFRRHWIYFPVWKCVIKLTLTICVGIFWSHMRGISVAVFVVFSIWIVTMVIFPMYRLRSSCVQQFTLTTCNLINCGVRMALIFEVKSMLLVASKVQIAMLIVNIGGVVAVVLTQIFAIVRRERWPVTERSISVIEGTHSSPLIILRETQAYLDDVHLRTPEFVYQDILREHIMRLDALFRLLLTQKHPLGFAVEELLEEAIGFHNFIKTRSILPYPPLEPLLPEFRRKLDTRHLNMMLVSPARRVMLCKLGAIRIFMELLIEVRHRRESKQVRVPRSSIRALNALGGINLDLVQIEMSNFRRSPQIIRQGSDQRHESVPLLHQDSAGGAGVGSISP